MTTNGRRVQFTEPTEFEKFKKEWADRFGFLAVKNPRDSFESIDEVATILYNRRSTDTPT